MLKVLHTIPSIAPCEGGPSFAMSCIERALADRGIAVTLVSTDDAGYRKRRDVPLSCPVRRTYATHWYFRKQTEFYKVSWPLRSWLRRNVRDFDIVHVHALFSFTSTVSANAAWRHAVPFIVRPLGVLNRWGFEHRRHIIKRISFAAIERRLLQRAAAIHFTSEQEKREASRLSSVHSGAVVPLGIDIQDFARLPSAQNFTTRWPKTLNRDLILFLSRISPKKGLETLLAAFATVRREHPRGMLVVAGSGDAHFVRHLVNCASATGLSEDILWTGFLDGEDKLAALAAAKVFVLPSESENFGIAALEALASGVPTVITPMVGIAPDVLANGAGIVVEPTPASLAAQILTLLNDRAYAREIASNARRLAHRQFSLDAMGRELINLYNNVLTPKH